MNQAERAYRLRVIKIGAIVLAICYFLGNWYATQNVAEACNYHPLLGKYITLFGTNWYFPMDFWFWIRDENLREAIPQILGQNQKWPSIGLLLGVLATYGTTKNMKPNDSHGSASWASKEEIDKADLGEYVTSNGGNFPTEDKKFLGLLPYKAKQKKVKKSGVVVGINPYTHKLMLHDGPEHMLLVAPTRSGKGVNTIIPTGLVWQNSIFFFDPKGELYEATSGYRKKYFGQKVMKFQPLCTDGSGARWNPLAEINFRTPEEWPDVTTLVNVMVKPDGEKKGGGDPFWDNSAASVLNGVIVHLLYQYFKEERPLPCPSDIMSFLSSPDVEVAFTNMQRYPHISEKEFLEEPIDWDGTKDDPKAREALEKEMKNKSVLYDDNGKPVRYRNILKETYGEYIKDFKPFAAALGKDDIKSVEDIRLAIIVKREEGETIDFQENETDAENKSMDEDSESPWFRLLTHPKVAECASNILNGAEQTRASILQTAQADLAIYQNPVVQKNTEVSDFAIRDLLDPNQQVSLYLVMEVKDIAMVRPLARLFINTLLNKLIRDMKFTFDPKKPKPKKQRLLLMLDEFPQLGNMESIELALAICAGYGIKICIVVQSMGQLNKIYTKENAIPSNCHVQIYFTPTLEDGGGTAKTISETLGKKTINTVSHSDGGGGFFKGSDSTSSTGRELMTPDEVSHMSGENEIVFVAGHKPIFGDKLRYYKNKIFLARTKCGCPTISDTVTKVYDYEQLFKVHELDTKEAHDKVRDVLKAKLRLEGKTLQDYEKQEADKVKAHEEEIRKSLKKDTEGDKDAGERREAPRGKDAPHERSWRQGQEQVGDPFHRNLPRRPSDLRRHYQMQKQGEAGDFQNPRRPPRREAPVKEVKTVQDALDSFKPRKPVSAEEPSEEEALRSSAANADEDSFEGEEPDFFDEEPKKASPEVSEEETKTEDTPDTDAQDPSNWEAGDLFSKMVTNKKKADA